MGWEENGVELLVAGCELSGEEEDVETRRTTFDDKRRRKPGRGLALGGLVAIPVDDVLPLRP